MTATETGARLVRSERSGAVAVLTLDRPQARNALSVELMGELEQSLGAVAADRSVKAVILGSTGPAFCSGHDLKEMRACRDRDVYQDLFAQCSRLMLAIVRLPQPVIARVQGIATAAGCQLVASCDLAVAAESARFATPGVNIGLFCSTPMVALSRNVSRKHAMEMLLTGDPIDAGTALGWGLVNRVVPAERVAAETRALLARATRGSARSKAIGKRAFLHQIDLELSSAYRYASEVMAAASQSEEARENMAAFLEKRPARFPER
jgi:enoyl-CoA hydratase/carnithine racemase